MVDRACVHGYETGGPRDKVYSVVRPEFEKQSLWMSEYGDGDETGTDLAENLILDFKWLHPTAWVYWQAVDWAGWGLIDGDVDAQTVTGPTAKFYTLAQFSRHIKKGMQILDADDHNTVVAYSQDEKKLVIVTQNWGNGQRITYDLSRFSKAEPKNIACWFTATKSSGERYQDCKYDVTSEDGKTFYRWAPAWTVTTFEIPNVEIWATGTLIL